MRTFLIVIAVLALLAYAGACGFLYAKQRELIYYGWATTVDARDTDYVLQRPDATLRGWVVEPSRAPERLRELIRYTQDEVRSLRDVEGRFREVEATQVTDLDRRLTFLNVLVITAPLFGLLGTVLGMLLTFKAIGIGGSSTSEIVARGISEALVATQTGMMVAIPGLIMATVAKRRRHEYVAFLARLEGVTLRHLRPAFPEAAVRSPAAPVPTPSAAASLRPLQPSIA